MGPACISDTTDTFGYTEDPLSTYWTTTDNEIRADGSDVVIDIVVSGRADDVITYSGAPSEMCGNDQRVRTADHVWPGTLGNNNDYSMTYRIYVRVDTTGGTNYWGRVVTSGSQPTKCVLELYHEATRIDYSFRDLHQFTYMQMESNGTSHTVSTNVESFNDTDSSNASGVDPIQVWWSITDVGGGSGEAKAGSIRMETV